MEKEAAKVAGEKLYKTRPFEGIKAQASQKETSFIGHAEKRGPRTAERLVGRDFRR